MEKNPESLHDIGKDTKSFTNGTIGNNNVAQSPLVSEGDMTKSQVPGNASQKLREAVTGYPGNSADQKSGNLMA